MSSPFQFEVFDGEGDIVAWFMRFEMICDLTNQKEDDKPLLVGVNLRGKAYSVYKCLPDDKKKHYASLKQALLCKYGMSEDRAYELFVTSSKADRESDEEFEARLTNLVGRFASDDGIQELVKLQFVRGMPSVC